MAKRIEEIQVRLGLVDGLTRGLRNASLTLQGFGRDARRSISPLIGVFAGVASAAAGLQAAAGAVRSASRLEDAQIDVAKTTDATRQGIQGLTEDARRLSRQLPFTTEELLRIAESAGQLGVRGRDNLAAFAETIARLGSATNLRGQEAANTLTRLLNVTGEAPSEIAKVGTVIAALEDVSAASASEIAKIGQEVGKNTARFKVGSTEALAFGSVIASLGTSAELGGSSLGRLFRAADQAVRSGDKTLDTISRLAGVTSDEFARAFRDDATAAVQLFLKGLGDLARADGDVDGVLNRLNLRGEELAKTLPTLALNSDKLADAIRRARQEADGGTTLIEQSDKAASTLSSRFQRLRNTLSAAFALGPGPLKALKDLVSAVERTVARFAGLDEAGTKTSRLSKALGTSLVVLAGVIATLVAVATLKLLGLLAASISLVGLNAAAAVNTVGNLAAGIAGLAVAGVVKSTTLLASLIASVAVAAARATKAVIAATVAVARFAVVAATRSLALLALSFTNIGRAALVATGRIIAMTVATTAAGAAGVVGGIKRLAVALLSVAKAGKGVRLAAIAPIAIKVAAIAAIIVGIVKLAEKAGGRFKEWTQPLRDATETIGDLFAQFRDGSLSVQTLFVSIVAGLKKIGLQAKRIIYDLPVIYLSDFISYLIAEVQVVIAQIDKRVRDMLSGLPGIGESIDLGPLGTFGGLDVDTQGADRRLELAQERARLLAKMQASEKEADRELFQERLDAIDAEAEKRLEAIRKETEAEENARVAEEERQRQKDVDRDYDDDDDTVDVEDDDEGGTKQKRFDEVAVEVRDAGASLAASGLTDALSAIADGSKSAGEAFGAFARQFAVDVARMITQALLLKAIQTALGIPVVAANTGGAIPAADASANTGGPINAAGKPATGTNDRDPLVRLTPGEAMLSPVAARSAGADILKAANRADEPAGLARLARLLGSKSKGRTRTAAGASSTLFVPDDAGPNTDRVQSRVEAGSFVIRRNAARLLGPITTLIGDGRFADASNAIKRRVGGAVDRVRQATDGIVQGTRRVAGVPPEGVAPVLAGLARGPLAQTAQVLASGRLYERPTLPTRSFNTGGFVDRVATSMTEAADAAQAGRPSSRQQVGVGAFPSMSRQPIREAVLMPEGTANRSDLDRVRREMEQRMQGASRQR